MDFFMAIAPVVIVGGIVVFVIKRINHKYNQGDIVEKKSKKDQDLLISLIPMGMLIGCVMGVILGLIIPISLLTTVSLCTGIGYLFGYFAFEIYSKKETIIH
ncbi:hypothetical protein QA612_13520 [Evansella sp. AB-P1]|uniref:hypothetical protein n=1 Tax=Evansella sp. AB-P1 TaxID=3037653 RepID=UPI00241FCE65|nr:hypothetical protein [Evansella sp. AB-P1]MDG5788502.1 hypothetical protein [Evansella sp. AB-P1]